MVEKLPERENESSVKKRLLHPQREKNEFVLLLLLFFFFFFFSPLLWQTGFSHLNRSELARFAKTAVTADSGGILYEPIDNRPNPEWLPPFWVCDGR